MNKKKTLERTVSSARKLALGTALSLGLLAAPVIAKAQTATLYGSLFNFDVVNTSGYDAHGFEIELEGVQPQEVNGTFWGERYGEPAITPSPRGTYVRYLSPYDPNSQTFAQTTIAHAPNTPFGGTCYSWYPLTYPTSGCEHFGVRGLFNATRITYRWLIADPATPGALIAQDPPVAVGTPTYSVALVPVVQPAVIPAQAVVVAEVQAPEPAENPSVYGDAQWMKVFVTQLPREVTLDELVADNPLVVPMEPTQAEVNWDIVQSEPAGNGNQRRSRKRYQGGLDPTTRSVVRRIELYNYTGVYDPISHEAICADANLCNAPGAEELGDFISAQMTAANVQADTLTITKTGNGTIETSDKRLSCGSKCVSPYIAGAVATLTVKPASGSVFTGWTGACIGANPSCAVTINGRVVANAMFAAVSAGGGGSGGVGATNPTLTVKVNGGKGSIISNVGGINCGKTCTASVAPGTSITLTATPAAGFTFVNWTGGCTGATATCTLTANISTSVQANFTK